VSGPQRPVAEPTPPLLNVANLLTLLRLLLVPVFFVMLMVDGGDDPTWRLAAFGVFAIASFTDRLDGDLARRRGLVTPLGVIADPIADKALTGAALVGLSLLGELPWWVTAVILGREVAVTGLRFWVLRHGLIPATRGGKLKTLTQTVAIGLYLLPLELILPAPELVDVLRATVMAVALVLTVVTGLDYVLRAIRLRRGPEVPATPAPRVPDGPA
jgi:CDP-diacylglycerol--glycerol-3-phosphate 3-phosphatidyltransferase